MIKDVLTIVLFISLFGLVGHYDFENEVMTHKQDDINKQEFVKDLQMKCLHNELSSEYCKGL